MESELANKEGCSATMRLTERGSASLRHFGPLIVRRFLARPEVTMAEQTNTNEQSQLHDTSGWFDRGCVQRSLVSRGLGSGGRPSPFPGGC